jgi:hypothetical protein
VAIHNSLPDSVAAHAVTAIAGTWDDGGDNSATISAIC